jgi:hypothetical protein
VTIHPFRLNAREAPLYGPMAAMRTISDEALMARIAAHDELAMGVLFIRHNVRIYRFALRLVRDRQQAEDLPSPRSSAFRRTP